jgi:hypothetical protein
VSIRNPSLFKSIQTKGVISDTDFIALGHDNNAWNVVRISRAFRNKFHICEFRLVPNLTRYCWIMQSPQGPTFFSLLESRRSHFPANAQSRPCGPMAHLPRAVQSLSTTSLMPVDERD